jgi:hypothetical protein
MIDDDAGWGQDHRDRGRENPVLDPLAARSAYERGRRRRAGDRGRGLGAYERGRARWRPRIVS